MTNSKKDIYRIDQEGECAQQHPSKPTRSFIEKRIAHQCVVGRLFISYIEPGSNRDKNGIARLCQRPDIDAELHVLVNVERLLPRIRVEEVLQDLAREPKMDCSGSRRIIYVGPNLELLSQTPLPPPPTYPPALRGTFHS